LEGDLDKRERMSTLADRLVELRERNLLKINHSVLELVVAKHLIKDGYDVFIEHELDGGLSCDVYATKGMGTQIVEVETGYVPPSHALDPVNYIRARIASKIARYSGHCDKFSLGAPPHYVMPVPMALIQPPRSRSLEDLAIIKSYCDSYYRNPQVSEEEILNARIHSVQIIMVERMIVQETDSMDYMRNAARWYE
jgi:hypothetical protein